MTCCWIRISISRLFFFHHLWLINLRTLCCHNLLPMCLYCFRLCVLCLWSCLLLIQSFGLTSCENWAREFILGLWCYHLWLCMFSLLILILFVYAFAFKFKILGCDSRWTHLIGGLKVFKHKSQSIVYSSCLLVSCSFRYLDYIQRSNS